MSVETWSRMLDELRHVVRRLRRQWRHSAVIVGTVAAGHALALTAFGVTDTVLFRPPVGVNGAGDLRRVYLEYPSKPGAPFARGAQASIPDFDDVRHATEGAAQLAAYSLSDVPARLLSGHQQLTIAFVSDGYFSVLRSTPSRGQLLGSDTTRSETPAAVISHRLWRRSYGGSDDAIGQPLVVNGRHFVVVGVAQRDFRGVSDFAPDVWVPLKESAAVFGPGIDAMSREGGMLLVVARIQPGTEARVRSMLQGIVGRLDVEYPLQYSRRSVSLGSITDP